jgi:hypothetical protein
MTRTYVSSNSSRGLERAKGLEPSTPTLARSCSTTELHPHPKALAAITGNGRPMPNAADECNSRVTGPMHTKLHDVGAEMLRYCRGSLRIDVLPGNHAFQCPPQRFEPGRGPATKCRGEFLAAGRIAVEARPPFDKGAVPVDYSCHANGGPEPLDRQRWRPTEFVGLRAFDVGKRQQPLPNLLVPVEHNPDRANRVAGLAILDPAFAGAVDPGR